jgi:3-oxoacyl-[acyl-carrier protein] reductase
MLTRVLARELAPANIDVNELVPGPVLTDMLKVAAADVRRKEAFMDEEWFKQPEDLLPLAMFLATQPTRGPTGQSFGLLRREV